MAGEKLQLSPGSIARELYVLDPDRDERAPQLCAEALLTLVANNYRAPATSEELASPKRKAYAVRSLALGKNFLGGMTRGRAGDDTMTPEAYGAKLAAGQDVRESANLALAKATLEGLIDPDTQRGQEGAWLLRPFHESLLWYDARKASPRRADFSVRKVYMRGSGITLARLLLAPVDPADAANGAAAVQAIQQALTAPSPLGRISERLEDALRADGEYRAAQPVEQDEKRAWDQGSDPALQQLASRLCRHAEGVMAQGGASGPARLWQLRTVMALDLADHALRAAWRRTAAPAADQYLLLSFGGQARAQDPVRQLSEQSYRLARIRLAEATVQTLAARMAALKADREVVWDIHFEPRSGLGDRGSGSVASQLRQLPPDAPHAEFDRLARAVVEQANYSRAQDGFRVLIQSVGLLGGASRYQYLTGSPDLLAAMVGALSARMPMSSREFFAACRDEWGFVINQESAAGTSLAGQVDGASLERNARRAERLLSEAGLAVGLSDRTTVVGERAARSQA